MGILRADVVSHSQLEPTGSVFFDGTDDKITTTGPGNIGTSDFTLECWVYLSTTSGVQRIISANEGSQSTEFIQIRTHSTHGWQGYIGTDSGWWEGHSNNDHSTFTTGWHHVVLERYGNDGYIFVDGQDVTLDHDGSSASNAADPVTWTQVVLGHGYGSEYLNAGYISNARISLTAVYEGKEFTVPKFELDAIGGTYLLCCQSSSSSSEAAAAPSAGLTVTGAAASAVTPDVKKDITDVGAVLGDNTKFDTLSYMVPPGGTTAESNRGRGIFADSDQSKTIEYISIQSTGNAIDFGDSTTDFKQRASVSSSTRTATAGGFSSPAFTNIIDFITIATTSNATDFGDLTLARRNIGGAGNNTRGIYLGGGSPGNTNTIDYITIATAGNASDFGDATAAKSGLGSLASPTRAVFGGGSDNVMEYLTIATTGNGTDFGDLISGTTEKPAGTSSSTRGLFICGESQPSGTRLNTIQYITIATTGNATDFGDNTFLQRSHAACNNSLRAVYGGGNDPSATLNTLSYVTIATTGNGQDFGDLIGARSLDGAGSSDSHGGIS